MGDDTIVNIVCLGPDQDYIFWGFWRAFLLEYVDVLSYRLETLLVSKVKYYDSTLTISKVWASEREELFLALCIPYLQSYCLVSHLQCQAFQVDSNRIHLSFRQKSIIHKSDQ